MMLMTFIVIIGLISLVIKMITGLIKLIFALLPFVLIYYVIREFVLQDRQENV